MITTELALFKRKINNLHDQYLVLHYVSYSTLKHKYNFYKIR